MPHSRLYLFFALICAFCGVRGNLSAETVTVSGTVSVTASSANDYLFQGNSGVLTVSGGVTLSGKISSGDGAAGKIQSSAGNAVFSGSLTDFAGTHIVGSASASAVSRDWQTWNGNARGSEKTHFIINTRCDSGFLVYSGTYKFGALSGSGIVRTEGAASAPLATYYVGALRTDADAADVFHGVFAKFGTNGTDAALVKQGTGTWILTNRLAADPDKKNNMGIAWKNFLASVRVDAGTLQIGDYGHIYAPGDLYYSAGTTGAGQNNVNSILNVNTATGKGTPVTVGANGTLALGAASAQTFTSGVTLEAATSGISNVNPNQAVTFSSDSLTFANGFTKRGAGRIILNAAVSGKNITLEDGELFFQSAANANGGNFTFDGGALWLNNTDWYNFSTQTKISENGGTLVYHQNVTRINGLTDTDAAHPGTLTISKSGSKISAYSYGIHLGDLNSAAGADFTKFHGTIRSTESTLTCLGMVSDFSTVTFELESPTDAFSGLYFGREPSLYKIGDLTGEGKVVTNPGRANAVYNVQIGAKNTSGNSVFSGAFIDASGTSVLNIEKIGAGTWTFAATADASSVANVNSVENLTVSEGTVALARREGKASAKALTVKNAAALEITAQGQSIADTLTVQDGARLQFMLTGKETETLLSVGTLEFGDEALWRFAASDDFLENISANTALDVLYAKNSSLTPEKFTEFVTQNSVLNYFFTPSVNNGLYSLYANSAALPEPSAWLLMLLGGAFFLRRRR